MIKNQLTITNKEMVIIRESMDRPNIKLCVMKASGIAEKLILIKSLLSELTGNGIIYCATRNNTEIVHDFLQCQNIESAAYHAKLKQLEKYKIQHNFMSDHYKVVVATNALGMGIDKSNLRFIIHFDTPGSLSAYYQEVGRCGRDQKPAQGILLFDKCDIKIQEYFINNTSSSSASANNSQKYHQIKSSELNQMYAYAINQKECLMKILRVALGENKAQRCLLCSNCEKKCSYNFLINNLSSEFKVFNICLKSKSTIINMKFENQNVKPGIAVINNISMSKDLKLLMYYCNDITTYELNHGLKEKIKFHLIELNKIYNFKYIISVPSLKWVSRNSMTEWISNLLKIKIYKLTNQSNLRNQPKIKRGHILLFVDYINSGKSITEFIKVIRTQARIKNEIVPFALASIK